MNECTLVEICVISFEHLQRCWKNWINNTFRTDKHTLLLVGLKSDIEEKKVSQKEIDEFCQKYNTIYFSQSAKNGTDIQGMFKELAHLQVETDIISPLLRKRKNIELICSLWARKTNVKWISDLNGEVHKFILRRCYL